MTENGADTCGGMEIKMKDLKIRWIGQGGYLFDDGETRVCVDPYLSDVVNRVAGRPRMVPPPFAPEELVCDALVCTHDHLDHVDTDAIPLMKKEGITFLAPEHAREKLVSCGVSKYVPFNEGDTFTVGDFELRAVYARHSVPAIGVLIHHRGIVIYLSGDTEYDERLEELFNFNVDVMIVCINGRLGNMTSEEAVRLVGVIEPKVAIPTHYGMFESNTADPKIFTKAISVGFEMEYNKEYTAKEILKNV